MLFLLILKPNAKIQILSIMKDINDGILSIIDDKNPVRFFIGRISLSQNCSMQILRKILTSCIVMNICSATIQLTL